MTGALTFRLGREQNGRKMTGEEWAVRRKQQDTARGATRKKDTIFMYESCMATRVMHRFVVDPLVHECRRRDLLCHLVHRECDPGPGGHSCHRRRAHSWNERGRDRRGKRSTPYRHWTTNTQQIHQKKRREVREQMAATPHPLHCATRMLVLCVVTIMD